MEITRVEYKINEDNKDPKLLAVCDVVLDNCLMLSYIRLCQGQDGKFYLILPSKQDVFKELGVYNLKQGNAVKYPDRVHKPNSKKFVWDEFFHPVTREFYTFLCDTLVEGYNDWKYNSSTEE